MIFEDEANQFIRLCLKKEVDFLLVGGAAVNFYGYKRHSADIDFWVKPNKENFNKIVKVLQDLGYSIDELPEKVTQGEQNISIKISPNQEIEIITKFNPNKNFDACLSESSEMKVKDLSFKKMKVIGLNDLISSKAKSKRTKDMLDIIELKRIHKL